MNGKTAIARKSKEQLQREQQLKRQNAWMAENTKRVTIVFNTNGNDDDRAIYSYLSQSANKTGTIKELLKEAIQARKH